MWQVCDHAVVLRKRGAPSAHELTKARAVNISACGNFGLVGYTCGRIDKYNMQSGEHRATYWCVSVSAFFCVCPRHGIYVCIHVCVYIIRTCIVIHVYIRTYIYVHAHICVLARARTHTQLATDTTHAARARALSLSLSHSHTHTHTHTNS